MIMTATEFKAKCLQILDRVQLTGERIQITKHGKIVAEVGPPGDNDEGQSGPGFAVGSMKVLGDIVEPLEVEWDALR